MKLLLDTHVWIWAVAEPKRLSRRVAGMLEKSTNELWLSPLSMVEILTLGQKGRLRKVSRPLPWIDAALVELPIREATITQEVALATWSVSLPHSDPADLRLAASAKVYDLTLVTADEQLLAGSGYSVLSAR